MVVVVAVEEDMAAAGDADVLSRDVLERGWGRSFDGSVGGVSHGDVKRARGVADADVIVDGVVHEAAASAHAFDSDAGVGGTEGKIEDTKFGDAAVGLAADGHAVAPVKVVVTDGHLGEFCWASTFD